MFTFFAFLLSMMCIIYYINVGSFFEPWTPCI